MKPPLLKWKHLIGGAQAKSTRGADCCCCYGHPSGYKVISHCESLDLHFPNDYDVEHLVLINNLYIFFGKMSLSFLKIGLFVFLLLSCA